MGRLDVPDTFIYDSTPYNIMNNISPLWIPDTVKSIMQTLIDDGHEAYLIGGAVRDLLLGETPSDWDVFTDASGDQIMHLFPHGTIVGSEERQSKILTVVVDGVEVSQYRRNGDRTETGGSIEKHLSTCDFTINAMAMDIHGGIADPHHGASTLHERYLACVGDPYDRLNEDPLRILRAIRFSTKYQMTIDDRLINAMQSTYIGNLPVERVRDELLKIIQYRDGMANLMNSGVVFSVIPELRSTKHLTGGPHHDESVSAHLQLAQNTARELTDNPVLIFACAIHDIGKPETIRYTTEHGLTFYGHEKAGANTLRTIMQRMCFSNADIKYATTLVAEHMYHRVGNQKTNRSLIKHFGRLEDAGITIEDCMILLYCDNQANRKNPRAKFGDFIRENVVHKKYYELKHSTTPFRISDLTISGNDLIDAGVPIGPPVGIALKKIFELVLRGELENTHHVLMYYIRNTMWQAYIVPHEEAGIR